MHGKMIELNIKCPVVFDASVPCGAGPVRVRTPTRDGKAGRLIAKGMMPLLAAGEQRVVTATVILRERRRMRERPLRDVVAGIGNQGADDRPKRWTWSPVVLRSALR